MGQKLKKKKSGIGIFVTFLLIFGIGVSAYKFIIISRNQHILGKEYGDKISSDLPSKITPDCYDNRTISSPWSKTKTKLFDTISSDKLNSSNVILIRLNDHAILMQKNSEEKVYPASLTKMMTAIVAIENLPDLKQEIKLTNSTFHGLYEADASMAGFQPGERVRAIDLLYGVMLPSGAECCIGLAERIAGSEENFTDMMNQKAAELGMNNTHFQNATGLDDENHYTTVKDLSILLRYALQNETFREVFTSSRHFTQPTNIHPDGITYYNTMFEKLKLYNQDIVNGEILGGKTGYTDKAGLCLASFAKVGKHEYILVTAGAKGDQYSEQYNITDAIAVYNGIEK